MRSNKFGKASVYFMNLESIVKELRELDKVLGETNILLVERQQRLREIINNTQAPLSLMVMGAFSTGKSTFINALLGKEVVSMAVLPTTAVVTKLCYGFEDKVTVFFKNGEAKEYSADDFARLTATTNEGRDSIHSKIDYVERAIPLDILRQVTIIDSPGLNSMHNEDTSATNRFVKNADTVLWMFSAEQAIGAAEIDAMEKLNSRLKPIAIINKMDTIDEEEDDVEEFLDNIKRTLNDKVEAIVGISAKMALLGQIKQDEDLLIGSNIRELRTVIEANVLPNKDSYKLYSLLDELGELMDTVFQDLRVLKEDNAGNEESDYARFVEIGSNCLRIEDACVAVVVNIKDNFSDKDLGKASVLFFNAVTEINGIGCTQNVSSGKATLTTAAMKNHIPAQKYLGLWFFEERDFDKAFYWLKNLTETDDVYVQFALAECYAESLNDKATNYYLKAAEQGHMVAQYKLGDCCLNGIGVAKDNVEAAKWFKKAAEQGHVEAQYKLGDCCLNGIGVAEDDEEAVKWYRKAAEQGHTVAQYNLGYCYFGGIGVAKDDAEAAEWFQKAAEQGDADAQCKLGYCYFGGLGVTKDDAEAAKWFKKAAEQGDADAQSKLGYCYLGGLGVAKDDAEAAEWFQKAAEQDDVDAQCALGACYFNGSGVAKDDVEAVKWYRKAAEQGHMEAETNLGACYFGGLGVVKDDVEAVKWYRKAAEQGHVQSQMGLGLCYAEGWGVAQDDIEAAKWYHKAAKQGDAEAQTVLGVCYAKGWGVAQNASEAAKWYRKAAKQGHTIAQYNLADCYSDGVGVAEDDEEAVKWYRKAAEQGHTVAQYNLGYCYFNGVGVAEDDEEAVKWYRKAAEQGHTVAQYNLADCYSDGVGVAEDDEEAVKWYRKAAEQGNVDAQYKLAECYFNAWGTNQNIEEAFELWKKSAEQGNVDARKMIARCYEEGLGVSKNVDEAAKWRQLPEENDKEESENEGCGTWLLIIGAAFAINPMLGFLAIAWWMFRK